jgi:GNAT superfamily N-acetyltransferase
MDVTIYYLEMLDPAWLRQSKRTVGGLTLEMARQDFFLNRRWYMAVGGDWSWTDRLVWSDERWDAYVSRPGFETWIASVDDKPAGYFELDNRLESGIEIASFGLLPDFVGHGLGGALLKVAVQRAWEKKPSRVWLHTCTLDHPQALVNYQARGFKIYKTETRPYLAS